MRTFARKTALAGISQDVLFPEQNFIFAMTCKGPGDFDNLIQAVMKERLFLNQMLLDYGGLYFHGFQLSPEQFKEIGDVISPTPSLKYVGGIAPRPEFNKDIALTTTMPEAAIIQQHHEMSYQRQWPMKIFFYCDIAARVGGETPICSTRHFMRLLPEEIIENFERRQVRNIIRYRGIKDIFPTWQEAFKTTDPETVAKHCLEHGVEFKWIENGLETSIVAQGVTKHPLTNERLWHNHAHLFWKSTDRKVIEPSLRALGPGFTDSLLKKFQQISIEEMPNDVLYGDGVRIESEVIETIDGILEEQKRSFKWEHGDFICLDNMLAFHGRNSYQGERRVLAILKDEFRSKPVKIA